MSARKPFTPHKSGWSMEDVHTVVGGEWYRVPKSIRYAKRFAINWGGLTNTDDTIFIAMDEPTWLAGSKNTGVYGSWDDTHVILPEIQERILGAIVQKPNEFLSPDIPQLVLENTYDCISKLGIVARENYKGKVVAITGTVGKSSTKNMLSHMLHPTCSIVTTPGNHNTRTGVPMALAQLVTQPDVCILEIAMSALWMATGSICQMAKPDIGIITEIGVGQANATKTPFDTAKYKARVCQGIKPGGYAILNGEMEELEFIIDEVKKFGAVPLLYGHASSCDSCIIERKMENGGTTIHAKILGEDVYYRLPVLGKGMVMNSVAALSAVKLLGADIHKAAAELATYPTHKSVLEFIDVDTGTGTVTIVDDSYNAEILSTIAAFDLIREYNTEGRRQVGILGRIVNLYDMAPSLHRSMAQPFAEAGFSKVFAEGIEMEHMLDALPDDLVGGLYYSADTLVADAAKYVQDGDIVLIKGSRRNSDFADTRNLLIKALQARKSPRFADAVPYAAVFSPSSVKPLKTLGNEQSYSQEGLGGVLLVYHILSLVAQKSISLLDVIAVKSMPADARSARFALGLLPGDTVSVAAALSAFVIKGSPDAGIALANYLRLITGKSTQETLENLAAEMQLSPETVKNVTGRKRSSAYQQYDLTDIKKMADRLFSLPPKVLDIFTYTEVAHKGRTVTSNSTLNSLEEVLYSFCFGYGVCNAMVLAKAGEELLTVCVSGARTPFERDSMAAQVLENLRSDALSARSAQTFSIPAKPHAVITLGGDAYFGEWYTEHRAKAGVKDALATHGYSHSFKKLFPFFEQSDCNILNFEAVLTNESQSPVTGKVEFILKGNAEKTVQELKKNAIHAVSLANNHSMDYGEKGLVDTLKAFERYGICTFGGGRTSTEAEQPFIVEVSGRKIIFMAAYWYLSSRHLRGYYALGSHAGSACIWDGFYRNIAKQRAEHKEATIVAYVHWNTDFSFQVEKLRPSAEKIIRSGADFIIGHGSHTISPIEYIVGKPVVYSLGNCVFNSNGWDFKRKKAPPYGFMARLGVNKKELSLRLYPIYAFNPESFWQPHPVTEEQFAEVVAFLKMEDKRLGHGKDDLGYFISVTL